MPDPIVATAPAPRPYIMDAAAFLRALADNLEAGEFPDTKGLAVHFYDARGELLTTVGHIANPDTFPTTL